MLIREGEKECVYGGDQKGRGGIIMNCRICGRENCVADPFLDWKPVKLSTNGIDVICFVCIS